MLEKREAPQWVWIVVEEVLKKSRHPEARHSLEILQAAANSAKKEWDLHCWKHELSPDDFGKTFMFRKKRYKITGIKPNSPRYPILGTSEDGRSYKFPVSSVSNGFK